MKSFTAARTFEPLIQDSILKDQVDLETRAVRDGVARYRRLAQIAVERGDGANLKPAERLLLHWYEPLVTLIREEQRAIRRGEDDTGREIAGSVLICLDSHRLAVITMHEALGMSMQNPGGFEARKLMYRIGRGVLAEANRDLMRVEDRGKPRDERILQQLTVQFRRLNPMRVNWWAKKCLTDPLWSQKVAYQTGCRLLWNLIGCASLADYDEEFELAFLYKTEFARGKRRRVIYPQRKMLNLIEKGHAARQYMRPRYLPMLVSPYPWTTESEGGYVSIRTPFISKPRPAQKAALKEADLSRVMHGLNAVGSTPWRINRRILEVMQEAWERGGNLVGIPARHNVEIAERPKAANGDEKLDKAWRKMAREAHERNDQLTRERTHHHGKVDVAGMMLDRNRFYFPHQLCFRGRAYPIPASLNHHGNDVSRGLLEFADPVPLTERGQRWLKIHLANSFGIDKVPFADRVAWVDANTANIERSVSDPIGCDWWKQLDEWAAGKKVKSWQVLAACFALTNNEGGEHLPIQIDGTCNGLQHYAAIGRDAKLARSVNLFPQDSPADVYTQVAEVCQKMIDADAAAGDEWAILMRERLTRTLCKQPVMTSVYGVTKVGARKQIQNQLSVMNLGLDYKQLYSASRYLANLILKGLADACPGAVEIMGWLRRCAFVITSTGKRRRPTKRSVQWNSPLGLPIVQPYRRYGKKRIHTIMQSVSLIVEDESLPVSPGRQADAFAPNYIHSVDATHMFMAASEFYERNMAFAAVHDGYWAHAENGDELHRIVPRTFVDLHSQPLLEQLHESFERRYELEFPLPPERGNFDIEQVADSPYAFS